MKINNRNTATKFKRIFFITSIVIALTALALFLLDYTIYALASVGVFSIWYLYFHVADYHYIKFNDESDKIILRYYKAIRFGKPAYHSIEFPKYMLRKVYFESSLFGKLTDVSFMVKTKRGIAEYPSVSLSAIPFEERKRMEESLNKILGL
jgi:hypothetical protein